MTPDSGLDVFALKVWEAVTLQNYRYVAALLVVLLVWGASKLLSVRFPVLGTGAGKALLSLGIAVLGGAATAFAAGQPSLQAILQGVSVAWMASGGWSTLKAIYEQWLQAKLAPAPILPAPPPPK